MSDSRGDRRLSTSSKPLSSTSTNCKMPGNSPCSLDGVSVDEDRRRSMLHSMVRVVEVYGGGVSKRGVCEGGQDPVLYSTISNLEFVNDSAAHSSKGVAMTRSFLVLLSVSTDGPRHQCPLPVSCICFTNFQHYYSDSLHNAQRNLWYLFRSPYDVIRWKLDYLDPWTSSEISQSISILHLLKTTSLCFRIGRST